MSIEDDIRRLVREEIAAAAVSPTVERDLLTIAQTQAALGLSRNGVVGMLNRGELRSVKAGRRRLIPRAEVERLVAGG